MTDKSKVLDKIAKELDKAVELHASQAKRIRSLLKKGRVNEDLRKWVAQRWVDIGAPKKGGGFKPCGRSKGEKRKGYPKCVPAAKAAGMSKSQRRSAVKRKRAAGNPGGKPTMVSTFKKKKSSKTEAVELFGQIISEKLCPKGKAAAKRKFAVYPSAYANMYASAVCSGKVKPGGKKKKKKSKKESKEVLGVAVLEAYKEFIRRDEIGRMKAKRVEAGTKTGAGERREPVEVGVDNVFKPPTKADKKRQARLARDFPEDSDEMEQARINLGLVKGKRPKGGMQG